MNRRLHNESITVRVQDGFYFIEESCLVWNLVNHVEEKNEVHWPGDSYPIDIASMQRNTLFKVSTCDLPPDFLQHPVLKVRRYDVAGLANQLCHWNCEESWATAEIQSGHALADM